MVGNSQQTQNIQINKVIGENEKCVFSFTEKRKGFFGQPNILLLLRNRMKGRIKTLREKEANPEPEANNVQLNKSLYSKVYN